MGFAEGKVRTLFLFSTIISAIGLIAAIAAKMPNISILLAGVLFLAHLPVLWMIQRGTRTGKKLLTWMANPAFSQAGFLCFTSIFSSGLGFLSWILLFEPGSLVRDMLIRLSPVIGWGVVVAAYLLAALGVVLNEGGEKRDGLLIGAVLFSVVGYLFLFWLSAQIFSFTIDDAYITFRYSKNLAAGFGPTYNPGQPPVEGYTTFLWMLLMTLPHFIGVNVATFSKILGILLTCGSFTLVSLLTFTLTRQFPLKARLFFGVFAAFLLAMLPITSIHAIAGMETSLFIFLIALMVYMVTVGLLDGSASVALVAAGRIVDRNDPSGRQCHRAAPAGLRMVLQRPVAAQTFAVVQPGIVRFARSAVFPVAHLVLRAVVPDALLHEGVTRERTGRSWRGWSLFALPTAQHQRTVTGSNFAPAQGVSGSFGASCILTGLLSFPRPCHGLQLAFRLPGYAFYQHPGGHRRHYDFRFAARENPVKKALGTSLAGGSVPDQPGQSERTG